MIGNADRHSQQLKVPNLKERYIKHLRIDDTKTLYDIYEFKEEIGHGSYGTVISAIEKQTSRNYAIKIVNKFTTGTSQLEEIYSEIKILRSVDHSNIIHLERVYESPRKIYMVFERCSTNLSIVYRTKKPFTDKISRKIIKQLVSAVYYLHKNDVVHRDIKMDNVLLMPNPDDPSDELFIKLSDFGLSIVKSGAGIQNMLKEYCGTVMYMPPEILLQRTYSELCDIWAIGIILYMLLTGNYPFSSNNETEMKKKICHDDPPFEETDKINTDAVDLIKGVLQKDPANRLTALETMKHPWLLENKLRGRKDENVLDYMKKWKSEMKLPSGEESDWVSAIIELDETCSDLSVVASIISKKKDGGEETSIMGNMSKTQEEDGFTRNINSTFPKINHVDKI